MTLGREQVVQGSLIDNILSVKQLCVCTMYVHVYIDRNVVILGHIFLITKYSIKITQNVHVGIHMYMYDTCNVIVCEQIINL